jgi:hypothetical protein
LPNVREPFYTGCDPPFCTLTDEITGPPQSRQTPKLYDRKTPITAADLLNDRVLPPFFEEHDVKSLCAARV